MIHLEIISTNKFVENQILLVKNQKETTIFCKIFDYFANLAEDSDSEDLEYFIKQN